MLCFMYPLLFAAKHVVICLYPHFFSLISWRNVSSRIYIHQWYSLRNGVHYCLWVIMLLLPDVGGWTFVFVPFFAFLMKLLASVMQCCVWCIVLCLITLIVVCLFYFYLLCACFTWSSVHTLTLHPLLLYCFSWSCF